MCDYSKIVSTAETAVSKLGDDKLKAIAFSEILKHLLQNNSADESPSAKIHRRTRAVSARSNVTDESRKPRNGLPAWLLEMKADNFFKSPVSFKAIHDELVARNHHVQKTSLPAALAKLVHNRELRRIKKAPDEGGAAFWHWANWG